MTSIRDDGAQVTETVITDECLRKAHEAAHPIIDECAHPAGYSKAIMAAFRKAKKASIPQDERSRRIVQELRNTQTLIDEDCSALDGQTTLFDFREGYND